MLRCKYVIVRSRFTACLVMQRNSDSVSFSLLLVMIAAQSDFHVPFQRAVNSHMNSSRKQLTTVLSALCKNNHRSSLFGWSSPCKCYNIQPAQIIVKFWMTGYNPSREQRIRFDMCSDFIDARVYFLPSPRKCLGGNKLIAELNTM